MILSLLYLFIYLFCFLATVVKVAFSASLLESGEGNIEYGSEFATLIFRNVFTNTGNHYNPNTGRQIRLLSNYWFHSFHHN